MSVEVYIGLWQWQIYSANCVGEQNFVCGVGVWGNKWKSLKMLNALELFLNKAAPLPQKAAFFCLKAILHSSWWLSK